MYNAKAYSAASATSPLARATIARRDPTEHDVQIEILFCGICHSDHHAVRNEWSEFMPTGTCPECRSGLEQFCPNLIHTFNRAQAAS
jgi:uncharacterized zinc-type alcohol dehydrogenase-like protein